VKLGIEEKQKEKGEEEGYMERNVHIDKDNEWWKIVTVYSKEMRKTTRRVENTMKRDREECMLLGGDFNGRIGERGAEIGKKRKGMGEEKRKTKWKMQRGRG
jgi:hypothetical protein